MGDVHLAKPYNPRRGIPTPIVIKRLHGELASNEDFVRRFKHEAEIAVSVDSKSVAKVYDVGQVGETLYIAMEFVPGWPTSRFIEAVVQSGRHASISAIVDLLAGGLLGLEALHTARDVRTGKPLGIVHRDISPKNLMTGEDGLMRLIDLGLGKSNVQDWKTRTGVVMGSVGYMPPEQVTAERVDHRADLYAMGAVLFELLALRHYIPRAPIPVMLRNSVAPSFEPPSKFRPDVPAALDAVVKKSLSLEPADRYQSAREFLDAVRAVVPERRSAGGMSVLINELFGAQLPERRAEQAQLLALPLPEPEDEGPEPERTIVFVQASGVAPLTEGDMPRTRVGPPRGLLGPEPVMPQVVSYPGPMPSNPNHQPVMAMAEPGATGIVPLQSYSNFVTPARQGVPVWLLAAAVIAAVIGTVAIMRVLSGSQGGRSEIVHVGIDPTPAPEEPRAPGAVPAPASPSPSPSRPAVVEATSTPPSSTPSPTLAKNDEPRRRPGRSSEPVPSPSPHDAPIDEPTAPPPGDGEMSVELAEKRVAEKFESISQLFAKLQNAGDAAQLETAAALVSKATQEQARSSDRRRALRELNKIEAQLKALAASH